MANANILISGLRSRRTRSRVLGANFTSRILGQPRSEQGGGFLDFSRNLLGGLFRGTLKVGGWLFSGVVSIGISARSIVDTAVQLFESFWQFNWNITDEGLDKQLERFKLRIAVQLGDLFGNLAGYVVCGVVPSTGMLVINEALGLAVLKDVGEEALDEFLSNLRLLLRTSLYGLLQASWFSMYKSSRRVIKEFFKNPGSPQSKFARQIFGNGFEQAVKTWGEEGSKPWSFAIEKEKRRDEIKDPLLREFWESADEEFADACRDALYIIADGIDRYALEQRLAQETGLSSQHTIEFQPNREAEGETIIMSGTEEELQTQMMTTMSVYQQIAHRDVGMIVGESLQTEIRRKQPPITLQIQLFNNPSPPFYDTAQKVTRVVCKIPGVKRSKLDWLTIKEAAGGATGYMWGRFLATANLVDDDDNYGGQIQVYGGSANEAERRLRAYAELSEYKIRTLSVTEELREGIRATNRQRYKQATRIFPAYFTVLNSEKVFREDEGTVTITGTYRQQRDRFLLWPSEKPDNFEENIRRLLRSTPG